MITYDSLPGYVDKFISPKAFSPALESCFRGLSIKNNRDLIYDELLSFINAQFIIPECRQLKPAYFQECYPQR